VEVTEKGQSETGFPIIRGGKGLIRKERDGTQRREGLPLEKKREKLWSMAITDRTQAEVPRKHKLGTPGVKKWIAEITRRKAPKPEAAEGRKNKGSKHQIELTDPSDNTGLPWNPTILKIPEIRRRVKRLKCGESMSQREISKTVVNLTAEAGNCRIVDPNNKRKRRRKERKRAYDVPYSRESGGPKSQQFSTRKRIEKEGT